MLDAKSEEEKIIEIKMDEIKRSVDEKYSYLDLDSKMQKAMFQKAIDNLLSISTKSDLHNIKKYLRKFYIQEYDKLLSELFTKSNSNYILEKYTANYFKNSKEKDYFTLLSKFIIDLEKVKKDTSFEDYCYLITKNKTINYLIESLIYTNGKLDNNKLLEISKTNLITLIDPYCQINNIDIIDSLDDDFEDDESSEIKYKNYIFEDTKSLDYYSTDIVTNYLHQIPTDILSLEEERDCLQKIAMGDEKAKKYFIEHNLRLSVNVAKKFIGRGIPFMDLIQDGNIGLITAIEKFDLNKGFKFSTYATWWIRQIISRDLANNSHGIRIPVYMNINNGKILKKQAELREKLHREPTIEEIASALNMKPKSVLATLEAVKDIVSYDINVNDESDTQLKDFLVDTDINIEQDYVSKSLKDALKPSLSKLTDRQQQVLSLRFGLNGAVGKSLKEIGHIIGVSRERVRQIQEKALRTLANDPLMLKNVNYLDYQDEHHIANIKKKDIRTIYSKLGISRHLFLDTVAYLDSDEVEYLQSIYGKDYYNKVVYNDTDEKLNYIFVKINIMARALTRPSVVVPVKENLLSFLKISNIKTLEKRLAILNEKDYQLLLRKYKNNPSGNDLEDLPLPVEHYFTRIIIRKLRTEYNKVPSQKYSSEAIYITNLEKAYELMPPSKKQYLSKYKKLKAKFLYKEEILGRYNNPIVEELIKMAMNIQNTSFPDKDINNINFIDLTNAKTTTELEYHVSNLTLKEIALLKERFGKNFLEKIELQQVTYARNKKIINEIIPKLNKAIDSLRNELKSFSANKELFDKAIGYFQKSDQEIIFNFYEISKNNVTMTVDDYARLNSKILPVLNLIIIDLFKNNALSIETKTKLKRLNTKNRAATYFKTDVNTLNIILNNLSEVEQAIVYKKFGSNLNEEIPLAYFTTDEITTFLAVKNKILKEVTKAKLANKNKNQLDIIVNIYKNLDSELKALLSDEAIFYFEQESSLKDSADSDKKFLSACKELLLIIKNNYKNDKVQKEKIKILTNYIGKKDNS